MCFLINFLSEWSVHQCERCIKFPHYCVTFNFVLCICLMYWGAPMLAAYIFIMTISSRIYPLITIVCIISCNGLYFKFFLCDMSISTSIFLWFLFAWNIFFQPLTLSLYVFLGLRWVYIYKCLLILSTQPICGLWLEHILHLHLK